MRGFPFFNLIICLFLSGGVLLPLVYRATRVPDPVVAPAPGPLHSIGGSVPAHVSLHFVHAPVAARMKAGETLIHEWKPAKPDMELEEEVTLPLSGGRSEFTVQIEWPAGTPRSVAELRIEPEGYAVRNANIWGEGSADEVVAFSWKEGSHE